MLPRCSVLCCVWIVSSCFASADIAGPMISRNPFQWIEKPLPQPKEIKKPVIIKPIIVNCLWQLQGISMGNKSSHALLQFDDKMLVVQEREQLDREWLVEKITNRCVTLKHCSGEYRELLL
jgi:hypothetical protein